jgi:uncharacterized protein YlxW (UPF0749 family)
LAVLVLAVVAGLVFSTGAVTSRGSDLRGAGGDVSTLLQDRTQRIESQRAEARALRSQVDGLAHAASGRGISGLHAQVRRLEDRTGLSRAVGPGLRVTLQDAPRSSDRAGIDPNILVVHQQDIQAFVNALWDGGAEAISLQNQRLISTTGIKCVGSTVVLDGVPYSPPYVLEAIGDPVKLLAALDDSPEVVTYRDYVRVYQLGLDVERDDTLDLAPYGGQVALSFATVPNSS